MRHERTEAARLAKKVKAAKKNWTWKKRTSSRVGTLPSLDHVSNVKKTPLDMTLNQHLFEPVDSDEVVELITTTIDMESQR